MSVGNAARLIRAQYFNEHDSTAQPIRAQYFSSISNSARKKGRARNAHIQMQVVCSQ